MRSPSPLNNLIACIIAVCLMPLVSRAAAYATFGDFEYSATNGKITILRYIGSEIVVNVPASIEGRPVTRIADASFYEFHELSSVHIPSTVITIDEEAFHGCNDLKAFTVDPANPTFASQDGILFNKTLKTLLRAPDAIAGAYEIPNSVTAIAENAFAQCPELTRISVPSSVSVIGSKAFAHCSSLTAINVDSANPAYASRAGVLFDKSLRTLIQAPGAYSGSYDIPATTTRIGDYAFYGCYGLTRISIPLGVTSIGDQAFAACYGLPGFGVDAANTAYASVDGVLYDKALRTLIQVPTGSLSGAYAVPVGVTAIRNDAFLGSFGLSSVTIPASVTSIGEDAFALCNSLQAITVAADNPVYASRDGLLFDKSLRTLIQAPGALSGVYTIPSSVTAIGDYAFAGCYQLTGVAMPSDLKFIGDRAFTDCGLTSVTIPTKTTSIGEAAFYGCESITALTLPESITSIGHGAFRFCFKLTNVYFRGNAPSAGALVFSDGSDNLTINFPNWASDFTTPDWHGYPAKPYDSPKSQTITFAALPARLIGAKFTLAATASSGLPVTFSVISGPAALGADGKTVTIGSTAGIVTIRASQPGGARDGITYAAAKSEDRSFEATPGPATQPQVITFAQPAAAIYGSPALALAATASSSLPVTFALVSGQASLSGSNLSPTAPGKIVVRATQVGSYPYKAAAPVLRTVNILPAAPALPATLNRTVSSRVYLDLHGINPTTGVTYSAKGLPAGLKLDAKTGLLSGVITGKPGSYSITATATAAGLKSAPATCTLTVTVFPATWASTGTAAVEGFIVTPHATVPDLDLPVGKLTLLTAASGAFTGTLVTPQPRTYAVKGRWQVAPDGFSASATFATGTKTGAYQLTLALALPDAAAPGSIFENREPGSLSETAMPETIPLTATLVQVGASGSTPVFIGELQNPVRLAPFTGKGSSLAPWRGAYTATLTTLPEFNLDPASPDRALPTGQGSAVITVAPTGLLTAKGKLADGTPWTAALSPDASAAYRCFAQPYNTSGNYLAGDTRFIPVTAFSALALYQIAPESAELLWHKPPNAKDMFSQAGFGPVGTTLTASSTKDAFVGRATVEMDGETNITSGVEVQPMKGTGKVNRNPDGYYVLDLGSSSNRAALPMVLQNGQLRLKTRPLGLTGWNALDAIILSDGVNKALAFTGQEDDDATDISATAGAWTSSTAKLTPQNLAGTYTLTGVIWQDILAHIAEGFVPAAPTQITISARTGGGVTLSLPGLADLPATLSGATATVTGLPVNAGAATVHSLRIASDGQGHLSLSLMTTAPADDTRMTVALFLGVKN